MSNNLRTARSPTERNNSVRNLKVNKRKDKTSGVRAKRKVTFVSDDDDETTSALEDFFYLIGTIHSDDEDFLTYKTTKIYLHKTTKYLVGRDLMFIEMVPSLRAMRMTLFMLRIL